MSMGNERPPRYVKVHAPDNVAIIVNEGGLAAGTRFESGLVLMEAVPEAHKVALVPIAKGEAVVRYGVVIGWAEQDLAAGSWVHEEWLRTTGGALLEGDLGRTATEPLPEDGLPPALEGFTFEGFVNDDGSVGTKNILAIRLRCSVWRLR